MGTFNLRNCVLGGWAIYCAAPLGLSVVWSTHFKWPSWKLNCVSPFLPFPFCIDDPASLLRISLINYLRPWLQKRACYWSGAKAKKSHFTEEWVFNICYVALTHGPRLAIGEDALWQLRDLHPCLKLKWERKLSLAWAQTDWLVADWGTCIELNARPI